MNPQKTIMLETERLRLRPLVPDDFEAVHSWGCNPENTRYMSWGPNSEDETRVFLSNTKPGRDFAVVLKGTNEVIGSCGIYPNASNDSGELGWILHKNHWKHGYGTELGAELIRYGFEEMKLRRIFAPCAAVNYGSYRVMERNGMRREALHRKAFWARVDREWIDEAIYAILAEDYFAKRSGAAFDIRPIGDKTRPLVTAFLTEYWAGSFILIRGELVDIATADGFALVENGCLKGVVTFIVRGAACEIVSLNSMAEKRGVGTALVAAVVARARELGCARVQLLTTNDNLNAIGFYQKCGFELAGVNLGAIDRERRQKPSIPLIGQNGIPMHHEVEFAMDLHGTGE